MNIDQYRAIKAQEEIAAKAEPIVQEPTVVEPKIDEPKPTKVEIDGKEVDIEELKNGYLRQSDYTKKTQDIARQRKEAEEALAFYEGIKKNPQLAEQVKRITPVPRSIDPTTAKVVELESRMYDMILEREIDNLQRKYPDFNVKDVLETASNKGITDLEDAYVLTKSSKATPSTGVDLDKLKLDLRKELLAELEKERKDTATIITSNNSTPPMTSSEVTLTEGERKVARMMKLTEKDYAKWRDVGRTKK